MDDCDEYCATHGCNQGRNCPVRMKRVQEAQRLLDGKEPLPIGAIVMIGVLAAIVIGVVHGW